MGTRSSILGRMLTDGRPTIEGSAKSKEENELKKRDQAAKKNGRRKKEQKCRQSETQT